MVVQALSNFNTIVIIFTYSLPLKILIKCRINPTVNPTIQAKTPIGQKKIYLNRLELFIGYSSGPNDSQYKDHIVPKNK